MAKSAEEKAAAKAAKDAEKAAANDAVASDVVEEEISGAAVTVSWRGQKRVYSKELHGKDFKALAKEFAEKVGGKVA